jgi:hypothetical protein
MSISFFATSLFDQGWGIGETMIMDPFRATVSLPLPNYDAIGLNK